MGVVGKIIVLDFSCGKPNSVPSNGGNFVYFMCIKKEF